MQKCLQTLTVVPRKGEWNGPDAEPVPKSLRAFIREGGETAGGFDREMTPGSLPTLCWAEVTWPPLSEKVPGELCPQGKNEAVR